MTVDELRVLIRDILMIANIDELVAKIFVNAGFAALDAIRSGDDVLNVPLEDLLIEDVTIEELKDRLSKHE